MHFIGNRAIILGDGTERLQLVYSSGMSVASAFLPILVLVVAFGVAEFQFKHPQNHFIALMATGVGSGFSVVGMHYVGNLGITNYDLQYGTGTFAASFIIAISDCLTVMVLFYTWREKWISHWWKRMLCSTILAAGITSMHFTASTNCTYHFKHYNDSKGVLSRNAQVIAAGSFCGTAALGILGVLLWGYYRDRLSKKGAQKVMLSCAIFDPEGKLLVTTDGMLPTREITDRYNHRTFNDDFDTEHPVFQWIFRVTHNWAAVSELIPKMKSHLIARALPDDENSRPASSASSAIYEDETYTDYSVVFRERFCVAALYLANSMKLEVDKIGILFENVIETGTLRPEDTTPAATDIELAVPQDVYGTGQLLFLTRRVDHQLAADLQNVHAGYKFARIDEVGRTIAETMQIPLSTLEAHADNLRRYVDTLTDIERPGTYLCCFIAIPKLHGSGFDVIVKRINQDQLPDCQILEREPLQWQADFLRRMHGQSYSKIVDFLDQVSTRVSETTASERQFSGVLLNAMAVLEDQVPLALLAKSIFHGKALTAHYSRSCNKRSLKTTIYSFVACADLNENFDGSNGVTHIPASFFIARQQCYPGSPGHDVLAAKVHQEFAPLLVRKLVRKETKGTKRSGHGSNTAKDTIQPQSRRPSTLVASSRASSDEYELANRSLDSDRDSDTIRELSPSRQRPGMSELGGILVNSETIIKSDRSSNTSINSPNNNLGISTAVTVNQQERTFVEELLQFIVDQRSQQQY